MSNDSAHKSQWEIGEVVFGLPFLISLAMQWLVPLPAAQGILRQAIIVIGVAFIVAGIAFISLARREFASYAQPTDPGQPTSRVIHTGVFAISRNPLYLGSAGFIFGLALVLNNLWTIAALLISIILCNHFLIAPEEKYLYRKFQQEYTAYMEAVHRWIGRK